MSDSYTYSWPEACGETPWKDGYADQVRRLDVPVDQPGIVNGGEPVGRVTDDAGRHPPRHSGSAAAGWLGSLLRRF